MGFHVVRITGINNAIIGGFGGGQQYQFAVYIGWSQVGFRDMFYYRVSVNCIIYLSV